MNSQIYEEASEWLVEFRAGDVDTPARRRFETWLSTSPEHVRAYLELTGVWEVVSAAPPADAASVEALIARAREASNVVAIDVPPRDSAKRRGFSALRTRTMAIAASLLVVTLLTGIWLHTQRGMYSTALGERRSILLSDGSTVELNARSTVRVRFNGAARDVELLEGEALFHVAKDAARPFIVTSRKTEVRALGTRFDINARRRATIVTVVEGTVSVRQEGPTVPERSSNEILLTAGEQTILASDVRPTPRQADLAGATAWTRRRLIFEATPLDEVAEEFNRNNVRQIIVEGAGLGDFHVSGAFSSSDTAPLVRFLRAQNGIRVTEQDDKIVVSRDF